MGPDVAKLQTKTDYDRAVHDLTALINQMLPLGPIKIHPWDVERFVVDHFDKLSLFAHVIHDDHVKQQTVQDKPQQPVSKGFAVFEQRGGGRVFIRPETVVVVSENATGSAAIKTTSGLFVVSETVDIVMQRLAAAKSKAGEL